MATKLFLRADESGVGPTSPQVTPGSFSTIGNQATNYSLLDATGSFDKQLVISATSASTAGQTWHLARFISEPLAAQTISGTYDVAVANSQSNGACNFNASGQGHSLCVWRDGTGVVATLNEDYAASGGSGGAEPSSTGTVKVNADTGYSITSFAVQAGDRIILELFSQFTQSMATSYIAAVYVGGSTESSVTNTTITGSYAAYINFSQTLDFSTGSSGSSSGTTGGTVVGKSNVAQPASAAGVTTVANATGAALKTAQASSSGTTSTANAGGSQLLTSVASAVGTNTTQATGVAAKQGVASAVGTTPSNVATGEAVTNAQAQAQGATSDSVIGTGLKPTVANAVGTTPAANMQSGSAIGSMSSPGVSTVQATGRSTGEMLGQSQGATTAQATGKSLFNANTTSVCNANLNGVGRSTTNAVANAAGTTPTATAPGINVRQAQASAAGTTGGVVRGNGLTEAFGVSDGLGVAQGDGVAIGFFNADGVDAFGTCVVEATGESTAEALIVADGVSFCIGIARQRGWAKGQHGPKSWTKQESA